MISSGSISQKRFSIFKNVSFSFLANAVGLITSSIITFVLPKFIGVLEYSYYQLYIFYVLYVGCFTFGLIDGIYLRYGGKYFNKLNKNIISAEFKYFAFFETFLSLIVVLFAFFSHAEVNKIIIYYFIAFCIVIYLPRTMLQNLLLATGQIKEYSTMFIIERTVQITLVIAGISFGVTNFEWFALCDIFGRMFATIYVFYLFRNIIFAKHCKPKIAFNEIAANVKCGLILMFSNLANMLVIGAIRQFIETSWSVETFGRISLTLSLSNFVLVFINSVSLVLFPIIKRCNKENLVSLYNSIRTILMIIILFILILYVPFKSLFSFWLPQYSESLKYMAILFPMCAFECKMNLLINTYYNSQRKEKTLLIINTLIFILSIITAFLTCKTLHNLDLAVLSIILLLAFRCIIAEVVLSRSIAIKIKKDIFIESLLIGIFIYVSWFIGGLKSVFIYGLSYIMYLIIKRKEIFGVLSIIKNKQV